MAGPAPARFQGCLDGVRIRGIGPLVAERKRALEGHRAVRQGRHPGDPEVAARAQYEIGRTYTLLKDYQQGTVELMELGLSVSATIVLGAMRALSGGGELRARAEVEDALAIYQKSLGRRQRRNHVSKQLRKSNKSRKISVAHTTVRGRGRRERMLEFVIKGGPVMVPRLLCSVISLSIMVERCLSLRRNRILKYDVLQGASRISSATVRYPRPVRCASVIPD